MHVRGACAAGLPRVVARGRRWRTGPMAEARPARAARRRAPHLGDDLVLSVENVLRGWQGYRGSSSGQCTCLRFGCVRCWPAAWRGSRCVPHPVASQSKSDSSCTIRCTARRLTNVKAYCPPTTGFRGRPITSASLFVGLRRPLECVCQEVCRNASRVSQQHALHSHAAMRPPP
jgi:hypothetical protein